jgi:hypothetical protein
MGQFTPASVASAWRQKAPSDKPEAIYILSVPLIYGQNKEPTSGLEPLT